MPLTTKTNPLDDKLRQGFKLMLEKEQKLLQHEERNIARRRFLPIIEEKSLERMEALLSFSTLGVHVLFENRSIAEALKEVKDDKDFYDFKKMKQVQDAMTELIAKKTYIEKIEYLKSLDNEAFQMLVRAYFHIVENTIRATHEFPH